SSWTKDEHTPASYLEGNQDATGFFAYQNGFGEDSFSAATTGYAMIALNGKTLPLHTFQKPVTTPTGSGGDSSSPAPPTPSPAPKILGTVTYAAGTLVKTADDATVYIVVNGKFRPFSSEVIFFAQSLKFSDVLIIGYNILTVDNVG